ncbi:hypothetical protein Indivirus_1_243 [Indivirus ILV1]|uniref:Uncharacterized protein n=1 Tax=Indivirus ILV1 TaxID=1977633 RepID=A0A1V0SD16_9VIRU|nr:hypothetical protein Indivirus_1_243 [Indivirus ILV1]
MNQFPEDFNRKVCNDTMEKNQNELVKVIRQNFHKKVSETITDCESVATLEFPSKLWHCHRITIIKELLERFGKVRIQVANTHYDVTKLITSIDDVPNYVSKVLIEFIKEN